MDLMQLPFWSAEDIAAIVRVKSPRTAAERVVFAPGFPEPEPQMWPGQKHRLWKRESVMAHLEGKAA